MDGSVAGWNLLNRETWPIKFFGHKGGATTVDSHPTLGFIVTGGVDCAIKTWSVK